MTIPIYILGPGMILAGFLLTFILPIQRGRLWNQLWDFITFALFVAGFWIFNIWDTASNITLGVIFGVVAILIRDFRLWAVRFRGQMYRRYHPRYWYGRAYDWYGRRRRRRY